MYSANANPADLLAYYLEHPGTWLVQLCAPPEYSPTNTDGWYNVCVVERGYVATHQLQIDTDPTYNTPVAVEDDEEYMSNVFNIDATMSG